MTTTTAPAPSLLRLALRADAVVCGLNGASYLLLAGPLSDLLGPSSGLLRAVGSFLLIYGAAVWLVGDHPVAPAVRIVITGNLLWTAGSLVVVAADVGTLTTTGAVWLVLQAVAVAGFAAVQFAGLRAVEATGD